MSLPTRSNNNDRNTNTNTERTVIMGKLLFAAMVATLAMTYAASPEAVQAGIGGVMGLGRSIVRGGAGAVSEPSPGPTVTQLPDGSWVQVPPGFEVAKP